MPDDPIAGVLRALLSQGHAAVDVFIVLSGFCLMLPLLRTQRLPDARGFLIARTLRIVVPYYAAMLLSLAAIGWLVGDPAGTHWDIAIPVSSNDVVSHLLLVHQYGDTTAPKINHAFWSIGVEYHIYFLFPLLLLGFRRCGVWLTTALAIAAGYAAWAVLVAVDQLNPSPWGSSLYYVGLFALGAAAAQASSATGQGVRTTDRAARPVLISLAVAAGLALALFAWRFGMATSLQVQSLAVGATAAAWIGWKAAAANGRPRIPPGPVSRTWARLGTISFSLYLIHAPVLEIVWRHLVRPLDISASGPRMAVMVIVGTGVSLAVALPFHHFVERPCHRWSRSVRRRSEAGTAAPPSPAAEPRTGHEIVRRMRRTRT